MKPRGSTAALRAAAAAATRRSAARPPAGASRMDLADEGPRAVEHEELEREPVREERPPDALGARHRLAPVVASDERAE